MKLIRHLPVFMILLQILTAVITPIIYKWKKQIMDYILIVVGGINTIISILILKNILQNGSTKYVFGNWSSYFGIEVVFDYITGLALVFISVIFFILLCYATREVRGEVEEGRLGWYFSLLFLLIGSMYGMAMAFDIFNLYVFMEVSLITSVAIIAIKDTAHSVEGAFRYLIFNAIGSGCILLGIGMIYQVTGYLNFQLISEGLPYGISNYPHVIMAAVALFVMGFGLKIALFPLHVWLPDSYTAAPTSSTAVLAGLVTKIYAIVLIRIIYTILYPDIVALLPLGRILRFLAALAILAGSFFAIVQDDIKRMLAYSSVSQMGYIVLGFSLFSQTGLQGAFLHIINYAFMKITLFLTVGNIIKSTGRRKIRELKGIGKKMPITLMAFTMASLAMIGIPPFNGFFSKWYLALGSLEAQKPIFVIIIIISSLLNAIYYLPIIINSFFHQPIQELDKVKEVSSRLYLPVILLGTGCLLLGLEVRWPLVIINKIVNTLMMGG